MPAPRETAVSLEVCTRLREACSRGEVEIPTLPAVAREVLALCQADDVDARRLAAVLHRDPSLASHVMRVANSPLHAPGEPIVSLQHAISRIGLRALGEAALAVAVRDAVFAGPEMAAVWRHSFATALMAKEVACLRRSNVESAFLCGLLHDVGRAVVANMLAATEPDLPPDELASAQDLLHQDVGAEVARQWRMPPQVEAVIGTHHDWEQASECALEVQSVHLADELAHLVVPVGLRDVEEETLRQDGVLEELSLYPDDVDVLLRRGAQVRAAVAEVG